MENTHTARMLSPHIATLNVHEASRRSGAKTATTLATRELLQANVADWQTALLIGACDENIVVTAVVVIVVIVELSRVAK